MHDQNDPRISPIVHHFSASRTSITNAITHLIALKYMAKNSGHGHPLRPAYVLTSKGKAVAEWAIELSNMLESNDWKIAHRSWTLPVLREIDPERRFGELRAELTPVTDRALSETLKTLGEYSWLHRHVDSGCFPPSVTYVPKGKGKLLVPILAESYSV